MAFAHGLDAFTKWGSVFSMSSSLKEDRFCGSFPQFDGCVQVKPCSRASSVVCYHQNLNSVTAKRGRARELQLFKSVELEQFVTSGEEDQKSESFLATIEELERMTREPSDVLQEMNEHLSARELQLVLLYFSQEGRDSWCALEVFEWLRKENKVDEETMELMVSIMCSWVVKLIEREHEAGEMVDLLVDMDCVGLKPGFSMIEKVISLYWEVQEKERAIMFVKEVLQRGVSNKGEDLDGYKGGAVGYLAWKMMVDGEFRDAFRLVINLKESGFKLEIYDYLISMTAVLRELSELIKALHKLKGFNTAGLIADLDAENFRLVEKYKSELLTDGLRLSNWAMEEGSSSQHGLVHERLIAMYICAGRGLEAERQLWKMKLTGREADGDLYDVVLAICASKKEARSIKRLLARMEVASSNCNKKTLLWLMRGYIKGGHYDDAAETLIKMLDMGSPPDYLDMVAVAHGLSNMVQRTGNAEPYIKLCKRLAEAGLIQSCLVYLYLKNYKLWIIKMV